MQWLDQGLQLQPQSVIHSVQPCLQSWVLQLWRQRTNTMHRSEQHRKWRSQWQTCFQGSRRCTVPDRSIFPNGKTPQLLMNSFQVLTFLGTWRHGSVAKSACWESMRTWILILSAKKPVSHKCQIQSTQHIPTCTCTHKWIFKNINFSLSTFCGQKYTSQG